MTLYLTGGDSPCFAPRNLPSTLQWYRERLGCRPATAEELEWQDKNATDGPVAVLVLEDSVFFYFYREPDYSPTTVPVLFSSKLAATHKAMCEKGIACSPIQTDPTGRSYFELRDLDGNTIEVCAED